MSEVLILEMHTFKDRYDKGYDFHFIARIFMQV